MLGLVEKYTDRPKNFVFLWENVFDNVNTFFFGLLILSHFVVKCTL